MEMQKRQRPRRKKHHVRNFFLLLVLVLIAGGTAYGMKKYQSIKNAVDTTYQASGAKKLRNVNEVLSAKKPVSILLMGTDTGALGRTFAGQIGRAHV